VDWLTSEILRTIELYKVYDEDAAAEDWEDDYTPVQICKAYRGAIKLWNRDRLF
jgi:hypothetical protein